MPGFNRQGPNSEGPMTGRSMGKCGKRKAQTVSNLSDANPFGQQRGSEEVVARPMMRRRGQGQKGNCQGRGNGFGSGKRRCHQ